MYNCKIYTTELPESEQTNSSKNKAGTKLERQIVPNIYLDGLKL